MEILGGMISDTEEASSTGNCPDRSLNPEPLGPKPSQVTACRARCESTVRWGGPRPRRRTKASVLGVYKGSEKVHKGPVGVRV